MDQAYAVDTPVSDCVFHQFSRLPQELRDCIWLECLPLQVCELDEPIASIVYDIDEEDKLPCTLWHTSRRNRRAPIITRVCRESRSVALHAGKEAAKNPLQIPSRIDDDHWTSNTVRIPRNGWFDCVPGIVHLNWTEACMSEWDIGLYDDRLSPIHYVTSWAALRAKGRASIMVDWMQNGSFPFTWDDTESTWWNYWSDSDDSDIDLRSWIPKPSSKDQIEMEAFRRLKSYLVVVQTVVIHMESQAAAMTGMFGRLGDAPVQVIDMAEEQRTERYLQLAEKCEQKDSNVVNKQDFTRRSAELAKRRLGASMVRHFHSDELVAKMQPAIMFRHCTRMCNHQAK